MCSRTAFGGAASALIVFGAVGTAHAGPTDDAPVTLSWTAPKECPSGAEVSARTAERLPPDATVRAKGRVEKLAGRFRLVLEIEARAGGNSERVIEAATCDALASSAAVVLAMSVTPQKQNDSGSESKEEPPVVSAPPKPIEPPPPPDRDAGASPRQPPHHRTTVAVRLQAIGDVGSLPAASGGAGVAIGLDPTARLHLEIGGNFWAAQDGRLASDPSRGASFQLYNAGARGCLGLTAKPIVFLPCLGAEIIVLSANGFGAARPADATSVGWAPEAALTLMVAITESMRVRAGLEAAAPTSRQAFVIAGAQAENVEVHRASAIEGRGWIGPEVAF